MQLTSTSEETSIRQRPRSLRSLANRPIAAAVIAFLGWLGFALARWQVWAKGHLSLFLMVGHAYADKSQLPRGVLQVPIDGYDGQFYYRLALDPFNWSKTAYGITMDQSYRYTRIGYPMLAWLVSLGQHQFVTIALVAVNLVMVAAMAYCGAIFARDAGRHALWGLAFVAYFGLVISVGRDTAEPMAEACMLGGLLAYRRERYVLTTVLFSIGALTRETILFAPAAIALVRIYTMVRRRSDRIRPGLPDLTWLVPAVVYGAIEIAVHFVVKGEFPLLASGDRNLALPFTALLHALRVDIAHATLHHLGAYDIALLEYATLAVFILAGLAMLTVTNAPMHERVAFVLFVAQLAFVSGEIWNSTFGDGRSLIEPYLMAWVLLLATPRQFLSWRYLSIVAAAAAPALAIVARRRILFQ